MARNRVRGYLVAKCLELAGLGPVVPDESEAEFQARVIDLAQGLGYVVYHTHDSRRSTADGFPDLVLSRIPRLLVAELKVGANQPTPEQLDWLERFRAAGIPAFVWWPKDWAEIERTLRG